MIPDKKIAPQRKDCLALSSVSVNADGVMWEAMDGVWLAESHK